MPLVSLSDRPATNAATDFAPVNILMYHNVEERSRGPQYSHFYVLAEEFRWQMEALLSAGYKPWTLRQAGEAAAGCSLGGLPANGFVVTFDDGYSNLYRLVHPIMAELSIPYTVFVVTDCVGGNSEWVAAEGFAPSPLLSWPEIDEMRRWSGVSIQAHTCRHDRLASLPLGEAAADMRRCKETLEQHTGTAVDQICYPYGSVTTEVAEAAGEIGYNVGVTTQFGRVRPGDNPLLLPRVSVHHVPKLSLKYGPRRSNFWWRIKTRGDRRPAIA
jgi:peptidoglycan/xylan/chitin deacetylase (PgdA/CDA1 family)